MGADGHKDPNETTVLDGRDPGETTVLCGGDSAQATVAVGGAAATTVIAPGAAATQAIGPSGAPDAAFAPKGYIPEQAVNPEMMPDSAFEPRGAAYSPSATSVLPAEVIAEQRRRNQRCANQGARYTAGSFAETSTPLDRARAQKQADRRAAEQTGGAVRPRKSHGCLVVFVTVVVVLALLALAAGFALDYVSQNSGMPKDEILARLASPVRKFFDGLAGS